MSRKCNTGTPTTVYKKHTEMAEDVLREKNENQAYDRKNCVQEQSMNYK